MTIKKVIGKLHLWLGLATGLVVFIVAITGCLYVFSEEISPLVYKSRRTIEIPPQAERLSLSQLRDIAMQVVPETVPLVRTFVPRAADQTVSFVFTQYNEHGWTYSDYVAFNKTVYVDPYTGSVVAIENTKWEFFNVVYWIHISLLLPYDIGTPIVTYSVYIFLFMLLSGLVLWWPGRRKKVKKKSFWFIWKKSTSWKRKNYDLHQILGFYVLPLGLVFAITGLFYASSDMNRLVLWIANGGRTLAEETVKTPDPERPWSMDAYDLIFYQVDSIAPQAQSIMIRPPRKPGFPYSARAYLAEQNYKRQEFYFDPNSLRLQETVTFAERNSGSKYAVMNYDLHVGSIGGLSTKILAFLGSLLVASLPVTGCFVWWYRNRKKKRKAYPKSEKQAVPA